MILAGLPSSSLANAGPQQLQPRLNPTPFQCPQQTYGDRDFGGNGPDVEYDLALVAGGNDTRLDLMQSFWASETKSNWSKAEHTFEQEKRQAYRTPDECLGLDLQSADSASYHYRDTDHEIDKKSSSPGDLHAEINVRGDTGNNDIGNCTGDDTKFGALFRPATVIVDIHPDCVPPDNGEPSIEEAEEEVNDAMQDTLNEIASGVTYLMDNVDISFNLSQSDHVLIQHSFFELSGSAGNIRDDFEIPEMHGGGRYTFFVDDINSYSVLIEPDGGGYEMIISMEDSGIEVRSNCQDMLWDPLSGNYLDPKNLTTQEVQELLSKGWNWMICSLGGEYTAHLSNIEQRVRFFLDVDPSTGEIFVQQLSSTNPEQDIDISFDVVSQSGPCEGNLVAGQDDCFRPNELELELRSFLQQKLAQELRRLTDRNAQTSIWSEIGAALTQHVNVPQGAFGIFVGDSDGNYGQVYFLVEN